MKTIEIKKGILINTGNFQVSIGTYNTGEVVIFSKSSGNACKFTNIRKGVKLAKVKRKFKLYLCSSDAFYFSGMPEKTTIELIDFLKK